VPVEAWYSHVQLTTQNTSDNESGNIFCSANDGFFTHHPAIYCPHHGLKAGLAGTGTPETTLIKLRDSQIARFDHSRILPNFEDFGGDPAGL
jgi:hypothetical protein